jgi:outer membrane protein assembly factor BamD
MPYSVFRAKWTRTVVHCIVAAMLAGGLAGCSSLDNMNPFAPPKYKQKLVDDKPSDLLYDEGLAHLNKGNYQDAVKAFEELQKTYPDSDMARKALLMQGFTNYEASAYTEAISDMTRFLRVESKSNDAAYAQYIIAMSYYRRIPDITRDQSMALAAVKAFETLLQNYPKSEYVADARSKLRIAYDQLAAKEMEVGRFYLLKRNYSAAVNRFRDVVAKYQTTRHVEEALMRLTECYMALGIRSEAQTAAAVLGHNFPDSRWYKDAYSLLQSGGLEPREDAGSWISRSFRGATQRMGFGN